MRCTCTLYKNGGETYSRLVRPRRKSQLLLKSALHPRRKKILEVDQTWTSFIINASSRRPPLPFLVGCALTEDLMYLMQSMRAPNRTASHSNHDTQRIDCLPINSPFTKHNDQTRRDIRVYRSTIIVGESVHQLQYMGPTKKR